MTNKQTGGPAFSCAGVKDGYGNIKGSQRGMTLRDYFAGQALAGMVANPEAENVDKNVSLEDSLANAAYIAADAMLKERDK